MTDPTSTQAAADRLGPLGESLESALLPACVRDAGGRYVAVNTAFADLVGLEATRLVGKTDNALQPADVAHKVAELDALVLEAHGHLDANETVLARDGRRTVRACRFPVYYDGEVWGVCVVMSPGDDPEAGRIAREDLQSSVGQVGGSSVAGSSEELVAERDRAKTADAEAAAAREALAVEREARLEAELQARTTAEDLSAAEERLARVSGDIDRLTGERDEAARRAAELATSLDAVGDHQQQLDAELDDARRRAEHAEQRIAELEEAGADAGETARDLASLRTAYADLQSAGEEAEAARERYGDDLAKALAEQQDLQRLLDEAIASREETRSELSGLREHFDRIEKELEEERSRGEWLSVELQAAQHRERDAGEAVDDAEVRRNQLEHALESSNAKVAALTAEVLELRTTADVNEETFAELESARERAEAAEGALADAKAHGSTLAEQLALAQQAVADADRRVTEAIEQAGGRTAEASQLIAEAQQRAAAAEEQASEAEGRAADTEIRLQAAETQVERHAAAAEAAEQARWEAEQELLEARQLAQAAAKAQGGATTEAVAEALQRVEAAEERVEFAEQRAAAAEVRAADAENELSRAETGRIEAESRIAATEAARAEAEEALAHAGRATHAEANLLREELTNAYATVDQLRLALAAAEAERDVALARVHQQAAMHQTQAIEVPAQPAGPTSLPPLSVAAEQAAEFAHAAAPVDAGPPPGLTDEALGDFSEALARAGSIRSAGKALLTTLGMSTGWIGGVLWEPKDDGRVFTCAETWVAFGQPLAAWETMAWRAHLEDGLVPAAAGSGAAHWAETEEMLACPRSRSADWASLGTLATVPVADGEGTVLAVLELVRAERCEADEQLLGSMMSLASRLGGRLAELSSQSVASTAGRM